MNKASQQQFLVEVDRVLEPIGFKRPKSSYEWKRKTSNNDIEWFHINFGLTVINPSFGVEFQDLKRVLPKESGAVYSVSRTLSSLSSCSYSEESSPNNLVKDIQKYIPNELIQLCDRNVLIDKLSAEDPKLWPSWSLSHRNRLLLLLMASSGKVESAKCKCEELMEKHADNDQIRPPLTVYIQYLFEVYRT